MLKELVGMKNLQELNLNYTQLTDAGLKTLKEMSGLEYLHLHGGRVTAAGVKELKAALSGCRVYSDFGTERAPVKKADRPLP
jgi:hypothetical protein